MKHLDTRSREQAAAPSAPGAMLFSLLDVAHALQQQLEEAMASAGLSMAKYGVLSQLAESKDPMTLSELAEGNSCVRSNITQLVDRLESDGFVRRLDDPTDRRIVRATITPLGAQRHADGTRAMARVQAKFASSLPAVDRKALKRVLAALK